MYKLSLVDVSELMAIRGILLSHETVRDWANRFGSDIVDIQLERYTTVIFCYVVV